jgi:subfamily B ATP-binding cassette protein MsbA
MGAKSVAAGALVRNRPKAAGCAFCERIDTDNKTLAKCFWLDVVVVPKAFDFQVTDNKHKISDFATWLRLLKYLRGNRKIVALVFLCIGVEAIFTVGTISTLKPVLNLLVNNRFVDTDKIVNAPRFEVNISPPDAHGTIGMKGFGAIASSKSANKLRDDVSDAIKLHPSRIVLDLSSIQGLSDFGAAELYYSKIAAEHNSVPLTFILPEGITAPADLGESPYFHVLRTSDAEASQLIAQHFANVPVPKSLLKKRNGMLDKIKAKTIAQFEPVLERIQSYSQQSRAHKFEVLAWIIAWMLFSALVMVAASIGVGYFSGYLATRVVQLLRNHVYSHMLTLDLRYFTANSPGSNMSIVLQDVNAVDGAVDILFSSVVKTPITTFVLIGAMFTISPSLTLFSFTVIPFVAVILYTLGKRVRRVSTRVQKVRGALASILEETFTGMRVVKAFNMENREAKRFFGDSDRILRMSMRTRAAEEAGGGLTQLLGIVTVSLMVLAGGYHIIITERMSGPDFVLFIGFLTQVFRPLKGISKTNSRIQRGLAGCDRVFHVLDMKPEICDQPGASDAPRLQRAIEFDHVSFTYVPGRPMVLKNINFTVPAGKSIALVGETGSGKSTIVNMLPRFYDPTEGAILYDGIDIRDLKLKSLRNQIALITQDVILFDDTIANNIAYGSETKVPMERIEAAARAANAHEFITAKPEGYGTMIGAKGVRLSGGERQRIAIARAIVKDCPILILDEATSSLDSETEALIQEALNRLIEGRTVVVIAHRLSTIQSCDEIYVIDGGRFVEHGTHEELLQRNGRYARFYQIQFGKALSVS